MEDYFINCRNEEERKILYRQLAQKYHPDKPGGSNEIMKEINKQYKNPGNYSDFRTETKTNTTNNRQGKDTAPPWHGWKEGKPAPWNAPEKHWTLPHAIRASESILGIYFNIDPADARNYIQAKNEEQLISWAKEVAEKCEHINNPLCPHVKNLMKYIDNLFLTA